MSPSSPAPLQPQDLALRDAYDAAMREQAEMNFAPEHDRDGPLWRAHFGRRGFVSYRDLGGLSGAALDALIERTVAHYAARPEVQEFEWKTRGHDLPADLPARLQAHGLRPEDPETVMVGEAQRLAADIPLPAGVTLRPVSSREDLERSAQAQARAFGFAFGVEDYLRRLERAPDLVEFWVAESGGEVISTGRIEFVPDTPFAGLWGGGTVPEWRGRGVYRALTAARARSAVQRGKAYLHSDCTEFSRPILERGGLRPVTTTTPYVWRRGDS